jgi:hypothetical protein
MAKMACKLPGNPGAADPAHANDSSRPTSDVLILAATGRTRPKPAIGPSGFEAVVHDLKLPQVAHGCGQPGLRLAVLRVFPEWIPQVSIA